MRHGLGEISEKRSVVTKRWLTPWETNIYAEDKPQECVSDRWSACDVRSMYAHLLGILAVSRR
jgi:hypothetical protein